MVETHQPVPIIALSLSYFQDVLAISSISPPASATQSSPSLIFSCLLVQSNEPKIQVQPWLLLRACSCGGNSSDDGGGDGDSDGDSGRHDDGGCDGDGGGGGGGGGGDCCGGGNCSLKAQLSSDCCSPCRRGDLGRCCLCKNCFFSIPSSLTPCRSTSLSLCWTVLGSRSCCWGEIFSAFFSSSPLSSSLILSSSLTLSSLFLRARSFFLWWDTRPLIA